ncbi:MAG TPA: sugar ABC transporter ATP-binding protein [Acetobacteraceae bacterium]|nr:sugar ABC transporter ATP-binding protein [Acetobacteraceae bacterium]
MAEPSPLLELPPLLEIEDLSKRFTGTLALDRVSFDLHGGEIHALLGQNGAGKSTLIKILAGVYPPSAGAIKWRGRIVAPTAGHLPIAFIHQDLGLVESMSVAENVALSTGYPRPRGLISWRAARAGAADALALMDSRIDPRQLVKDLAASDKAIVAIARALSVRGDALVLDEPTAALPSGDVDHLLAVLHRLRANGLAVIYVTHRLDEVFRIADRVSVLRDGRLVSTSAVNKTNASALVQWIVGRKVAETPAPPRPAEGSPLLSVQGLVVPAIAQAGRVGPVSFALAPGETLALVGLRGAGHHTTGRAIFGAVRRYAGSVLLDGQALEQSRPAEAMARGIGFVSSLRGTESLALDLSVQENLFLNPTIRGYGPFQPVGPQAERAACERALARFAVRPPDSRAVVARLSGGNQQKLVLARWLSGSIRVLILEEPTIGVDVGAKADIYRDLQAALARGLGVLLISSDFDEIEKLCHRAIVFSRGRVVAEVGRDRVSQERLTALAAGATAQDAA